jgi:uncharacterized protein YuzE
MCVIPGHQGVRGGKRSWRSFTKKRQARDGFFITAFFTRELNWLEKMDEIMAMSIPLPTRQILALFQQNNTEALSLVAASGCCSRMQPGMDYDKEADALYVNFQRPARDAWVSARSGRSAPDASSNPSGLRPAPDAWASRRRRRRPAAADHSEMTEDDTVLRYQGDRIIGFTILNASTRE